MRNIVIASVMLSSAALAVPALAQDTPGPVTPSTPVTPAPETPSTTGPVETPAPAETPATPAPTAPPAAGMDAAPSAVVAPVTDASVLSSNLVGLTVRNTNDETIGEIRDLVLGAGNALTGVIVSVGGFLGLGEHYVVIDPASIAVSYNETDNRWDARLNATADELKASPAFKYEGKFGR